jgi:hypothetical protein
LIMRVAGVANDAEHVGEAFWIRIYDAYREHNGVSLL